MARRTRNYGRSEAHLRLGAGLYAPLHRSSTHTPIPVTRRWRVNETYIKIGKRWHYLFRAIDDHGHVVDVYLSNRRDRAVAQAFFEGAIETSTVRPNRVTTDTAKCYPPALQAVLPEAEHCSSKYLNNGLEWDHQQGCPLVQGTGTPDALVQNASRRKHFLSWLCLDPESAAGLLVAHGNDRGTSSAGCGMVRADRNPLSAPTTRRC